MENKESGLWLSPNNARLYSNAKKMLEGGHTKTARKKIYSTIVWSRFTVPQRKVLAHYRDSGVWLANNTFEKPKSPSPRTKRSIKVKSNFETYWKAITPANRSAVRNFVSLEKMEGAGKVRANFESYWASLQPENRNMIRNYVKNYRTPSPIVKNESVINLAKREVNAMKTAIARKAYLRQRAVNLSLNNWKNLGRYISQKNYEAQLARTAKRSARA
jgi:hypothetical protein